jgi:hypothetical protein
MTVAELRKLRNYPGSQPTQLQWISCELAAQIAELNTFNRYIHGSEEERPALQKEWFESRESR